MYRIWEFVHVKFKYAKRLHNKILVSWNGRFKKIQYQIKKTAIKQLTTFHLGNRLDIPASRTSLTKFGNSYKSKPKRVPMGRYSLWLSQGLSTVQECAKLLLYRKTAIQKYFQRNCCPLKLTSKAAKRRLKILGHIVLVLVV